MKKMVPKLPTLMVLIFFLAVSCALGTSQVAKSFAWMGTTTSTTSQQTTPVQDEPNPPCSFLIFEPADNQSDCDEVCQYFGCRLGGRTLSTDPLKCQCIG